MSNAISSYGFARALYEEGVLPEECVSAELLTPSDGALQLRFVVNVTAEDAEKIQRAFARATTELLGRALGR